LLQCCCVFELGSDLFGLLAPRSRLPNSIDKGRHCVQSPIVYSVLICPECSIVDVVAAFQSLVVIFPHFQIRSYFIDDWLYLTTGLPNMCDQLQEKDTYIDEEFSHAQLVVVNHLTLSL